MAKRISREQLRKLAGVAHLYLGYEYLLPIPTRWHIEPKIRSIVENMPPEEQMYDVISDLRLVMWLGSDAFKAAAPFELNENSLLLKL